MMKFSKLIPYAKSHTSQDKSHWPNHISLQVFFSKLRGWEKSWEQETHLKRISMIEQIEVYYMFRNFFFNEKSIIKCLGDLDGVREETASLIFSPSNIYTELIQERSFS